MAKTITAFKVQTILQTDARQHHAEYQKAEKDVAQYVDHVKRAGKDTAKAFDGVSVGKKFGKDMGIAAVAELTNSFSVSTLGGLIGTAVAPGVGTAIGSAIGGGIDKALSTVTPILLNQISSGIALNKLLEETAFEFKTFAGSEKEAKQYLGELLEISKQVGILPQILIDASEKTFDLTGNLKLTRSILKAATDQAADFGGSAEVFENVASTLGLIAEKGELAGKELQKLYRMGIDAKKYLLEATGLQEKQLERLMAAGRIRGDVAARLIAEGIEREKGGYAAARTGATVAGRERQFNVLTQLRSMEGTQEATRAISDFYEKANSILDSPQAKAFTQFINTWSGKLIDFTEGALRTGVSVGAGVAEGILNFNPSTMMSSVTKLQSMLGTMLGNVFELHSPSKWSAREIGIPLAEGIFDDDAGSGMLPYIKSQGRDRLVAALEALLADPKVQALLNTIQWAEHGALGRIVGGKEITPGVKHPNIVGLRTSKGPSTAAGNYQITGTNWRKAEQALGPLNFSSPHDQALVALWLMTGHGGGAATLQSGDISRMMGLAAKDWTSTPGSRIGGGGQKPLSQWLGAYQSMLGGGKPIDRSNPMPVVVVQDINGGATLVNQMTASGNGSALLGTLFAWAQNQKDITLTLGAEDAAIVNVIGNAELLTTKRAEETMATSIQMRSLIPLINAEQYHADTSIALTKQYQQAAREELIKGLSFVDQLSGMIGQVAGMLPSQQVGKKRGFFSKLLGFAAPFLSFIPGVGPILPTIAGAASGFVGGNYAAGVSTIASGLQPGGVFRPSHISGSPGHRAFGGSVYAGRPYIVGEHRPELFVPNQNGWIHPSVSGGGLHPAHVQLLEEIRDALAAFRSMPADHVVMKGAHGLTRRLARDPSLVEGMGRSLNLAR